LEIALGHPAYVIRINPTKNTIRLGTAEELMQDTALLSGVRFDEQYQAENHISVRIRYRSTAVEARIETLKDSHAIVHFSSPVSALTPGQSAVIYDGDLVIGGGIIEDNKLLKKYPQK
jgi:tRNA-specific 2-thiouridylase